MHEHRQQGGHGGVVQRHHLVMRGAQWGQAQRLGIGGKGLGAAAGQLVQVAQLQLRIGIGGGQPRRLAIGRAGVLQLALFLQRVAQLDP